MITKLRLFRDTHPGGVSDKDHLREKINEIIEVVDDLVGRVERMERHHHETISRSGGFSSSPPKHS